MTMLNSSIRVDLNLPQSVPKTLDKKFYISNELINQLSDYGNSVPNKEVCGLVTGKFDQFLRAEKFHPIINVSTGEKGFDDYVMDPNQSMSILKHTQVTSIDDHKFDLVAIFHTHPHSTPYPSIIDIKYAAYNVVYIIYSVILEKFSFNFWDGNWFVPIDVRIST